MSEKYLYEPTNSITLQEVERLSFFSGKHSFINSVNAANAIFNRDYAANFLRDETINLDIINQIKEIYKIILDTIHVDSNSLMAEASRCKGLDNVGKSINIGCKTLIYQENKNFRLDTVPLLPSEMLALVYRKEGHELCKQYMLGEYSENLYDFKGMPFVNLKYIFYNMRNIQNSNLSLYFREWERKIENLAQDFLNGIDEDEKDIIPKQFQIRMR